MFGCCIISFCLSWAPASCLYHYRWSSTVNQKLMKKARGILFTFFISVASMRFKQQPSNSSSFHSRAQPRSKNRSGKPLFRRRNRKLVCTIQLPSAKVCIIRQGHRKISSRFLQHQVRELISRLPSLSSQSCRLPSLELNHTKSAKDIKSVHAGAYGKQSRGSYRLVRSL